MGDLVPRPLPGLRPWTPLGDFRSQTPSIWPSIFCQILNTPLSWRLDPCLRGGAVVIFSTVHKILRYIYRPIRVLGPPNLGSQKNSVATHLIVAELSESSLQLTN